METGWQIYHAEPNFECSPWNDWALIDWGEEGEHEIVLGQLKAFVDLTDLPEAVGATLPDAYVIFELAVPTKDPAEYHKSNLWEPWEKQPPNFPNFDPTVHHRTEIISINRILGPAVVVPDLGNENPRAYLKMVPISEWKFSFDDWLALPHRREWERKEENTGTDGTNNTTENGKKTIRKRRKKKKTNNNK